MSGQDLQLKVRWGWSLSELVALLRMNVVLHRDLLIVDEGQF